ncbi:putative reverse transcriptase domain-containing protein [Tanacetum coccineum]
MVSAIKDPLTFNDLMATPIDFSNNIELEYNFQERFNAFTDKLYWNNPEGDHYPFDLSKPLPLQGHPGHLIVVVDYLFNNDLEYLKTFDLEKTYTTSITKTKAARYESVGIKDMTTTLWSTIKHVYDKDAEKGIKHWGERRKLCVKKLHGYGHLEKVVVKRADRQLYKFKEGDFVDLHLNDIEDMLLLAVQHKLFHLNESDIVDFIVALRMFTRSLIIKRRVEDLQLGVESYQKKLNITAPQKTFPEIEFKELYTPSYKPPGVIYEDLNKQKRVMRADELYKFSDGTLKKVRDELHHRILDFRLGYNDEMSRRKWTAIDKKRSELMVELIDKQMRERRIIRNLERLVGARELEMDYKLMTRTNRRDLPRDIPLDRIEVLRYDTKGVKVRKGKMQTKTELTLEQTQQGVSDEVLALFKVRFEQAIDSQKLNIKKIEQQLRTMNVNSDAPVTMANIQRVASTFLNAIDKKEGSPYVFHGDKKPHQVRSPLRITRVALWEIECKRHVYIRSALPDSQKVQWLLLVCALSGNFSS